MFGVTAPQGDGHAGRYRIEYPGPTSPVARRCRGSNRAQTCREMSLEPCCGRSVSTYHKTVSESQFAPGPTVSSIPCPSDGTSQPPSEPEIRPGSHPIEEGAKNGLFQPNLILAQKTGKWTSRSGHTTAAANQQTLNPSSRNSLMAPCDLVHSDFPASWSHGGLRTPNLAKSAVLGYQRG